MLFKNGKVFYKGELSNLDVRTSGSFVKQVGKLFAEENEEVKDCANMLVLPGLIEIHSHGCMGSDFSSASLKDIAKMTDFYIKHGITGVCATTMTMPRDRYRTAMTTIREAIENPPTGARIVGINMEGPFLGAEKKGAHDERYLEAPDLAYFEELDRLSGGNIKLVDLDPDYPESIRFIKHFSSTKTISVAHTSCSYETALIAFENGASNITHLFNAMNGLLHREPGVVGAFSDYIEKNVTAEIICDGFHINPSVIRMMFKLCGENMVLISDSMCAAGLEDGEYELGGIPVFVKDGKATQANGTIAGSTVNVFDCMVNAINFGVPVNKAINSASGIPAKAIKMDDKIGAVHEGLDADIIITGERFNLSEVYLKGNKIK